jgi:hypothetical protein
MPPLPELLAVLAGFAARLVVPVALTLLAAVLLRRLDARWQAQAAPRPLPAHTPCWELHQCTAERRAACPAYGQSTVPCWQFHRDARGNLQPDCLTCDVLRLAPAPQPA